MRLLFASAFPFLPHSTNGREVTVDAMARALVGRGMAAAVFSGLPPGASAGAGGLHCDHGFGYPVFRAERPQEAYAAVLAAWNPGIVLLPLSPGSAPLASLGLGAGIPALFHVVSATPGDLATPLIAQPGIGLVANSAFTARRLETMFGHRPPVLPVLIERERYRVAGPGDSVLMVNPTAQKGAEIFFQLAAAHPEIPFLAVESWDVGAAWRTVLINRARRLGNVALWPPVEDMREAFGRARVLLAPSIFEETFGRVVAEAQVSGIPALASDRGALPETLGGGGLVVPLDAGFAVWAQALRRLWADPAPYSAAALVEAERPERAPDAVIDRLMQIVAAFPPPDR